MDEASSKAFGDQAPAWLDDPEYMVFAGDVQLAPGATREHALGDRFRNMFARSKEAVRADWQQVVGQMRTLLDQLPVDQSGYVMDEIAFELGFSAEGKVVLIAQAGVTATISVTFKRKDPQGG